MKNFFRCISILLIICMLIGNTVSASAADSTEKESQKTWNVTISTLDSDGSRLAGVTLTVKPGADGIAAKVLTTALDSAAEVNLTPGSYTISEKTVPDGYEKAADLAFTLDAEGNAAIQEESGTKEAADRQITIVNPKSAAKETAADADNDTVSAAVTAQSTAAAQSKTTVQSESLDVSSDSITPMSTEPADAASSFHATIVTKDGDSEYVSGSTVTFLIKYKLDYGTVKAGDYVYLTVPKALAVARLSVDPTHFSSSALDHTDSDGNQVYKLVFTDEAAKEGISGNITLRVTANNDTGSSITPTVEAGNDSLSITVIPGGTPGTGVETRAIEKDALGADSVGMSTGWNSKEGGYSIYDPDQGATAQYRVYVNLKEANMTDAAVTDYLPSGLTFEGSITYVWTKTNQSDVALSAEELAQISFQQDGNKLIWKFGSLLSNQKELLIRYKALVPAGVAATYHNAAVISYTENGETKTESANRNIYPESNADASHGVKSVDKTEISDDPADQYVEYTLTFKTHSDSAYNMIPFEIGDIDLNDKLNDNVVFDHVSYTDENFSVTYDQATNTVHIENIKKIADSGDEHEVSFVVSFKNVPVGTTVTNTVGGNTVKTTKYGGSLDLTAVKTLNGTKPGNHTFQFQLQNSAGKVLQTKTNNTDGTISFDKISYSKSDIGKTYTYTVKEVPGEDTSITYDNSVYTVSVTPKDDDNDGKITADPVITKNGTAADSLSFDNGAETSVGVTKKWIGAAASSAVIDLYADGVKTDKSKTLTADDNWQYTFAGLDKYKDGKEIAYTVQEETLNGYSTLVSGDAVNGYTITNTNTAKIFIPVTKTWVGTAGTEADVTLLADGTAKDTAVLTAATGWKHTFENLPKYDSVTGKEISYTLTEKEMDGYTEAVTGTAASGYTVTNTITGQTSVGVTKKWIGAAASSVVIDLYADGVKTDKSKTLTADDNWQYTFAGLDKYKDGKEIAYTVQEETLNGYSTAVSGDAANGYTITNTNTTKISIPVTKTWVGTAGTEADVTLLADGAEKDTAVLTAATGWKHTFENLPKYDSVTGKEISYTLTEKEMDGYTEAVTGTAANGFTVTNTITGQTSVGVTKKWIGAAASSVVIDLYADGVKADKSKTLTADDNWQYTFTGLDKYKDGKEIAYTVQEETLNGYSTAVSGDAANGYTITNTNTTKISIPVTKTWVGTAGTEADVTLLADGAEKDTAVLTAATGWKHTFENLPKYDSVTGKEISYTLTEKEMDGYTEAVTGTAADGFTVTNTIIPKDTESYTALKTSDVGSRTLRCGDYITYYIKITNTGNTDLVGLWARDYIPDYTHYISSDHDGERGAVNGRQQVSWFIDSLKPGSSETISMVVAINDCIPAGAVIRNTAFTALTHNPKKPDVNYPTNPQNLTNEVVLNVADSAADSAADSNTSSPKTGDSMNAKPYVILAGASLMLAIVMYRRKKKYHN